MADVKLSGDDWSVYESMVDGVRCLVFEGQPPDYTPAYIPWTAWSDLQRFIKGRLPARPEQGDKDG